MKLLSTLSFEVIRSEELLKTPIFKVRRDWSRHPLKSQEVHPFYVLEQASWVNVIAWTQEQQCLLIRQWRHGSQSVEWEIPAGLMEEGETPLQAAARELKEETGFEAKSLTIIGEMLPNPAYQSNRCWTVLAEGCAPKGEVQWDEDEVIEIRQVSLDELKTWFSTGKIRHGIVRHAIYRWLEWKGCIQWPIL